MGIIVYSLLWAMQALYLIIKRIKAYKVTPKSSNNVDFREILYPQAHTRNLRVEGREGRTPETTRERFRISLGPRHHGA